jgi:hypothetical protein
MIRIGYLEQGKLEIGMKNNCKCDDQLLRKVKM